MTKPAAAAAAKVVLLFFASVLGGFSAARTPELARPIPPRMIEPRMTTPTHWRKCTLERANDRTLETVTCGDAHIPAPVVSSVVMCRVQRLADAVQTLATSPQCVDAVVTKLAAVARVKGWDGRVLSDLSAAYYTRAFQQDTPSDLVRALDAAERAVKAAPSLPEARFNRALAQESLGFLDEAIVSWDELRRSDASDWGREAETRWQNLTHDRASRAAAQWPLNRKRLPEAVRLGNRATISALISPFRSAAQRYVEGDVLPAWARAANAGNSAGAAAELQIARAVSSELSRLTGDRYLEDVVDRIRPASAERLAILKRAHLAYGDGFAADREHRYEQSARWFANAAADLETAGSPLRFGAAIHHAVARVVQRFPVQAELTALDRIEARIPRARYRYLLARLYTTRALFLIRQSRYLEALAQYNAAEAIYEAVEDPENLGGIHTRKTGVLRTIGQADLTWHQAIPTRRYLRYAVDAQARHVALGEMALSAAALGYPSIGLQYQNAAVRLLEDELASAVARTDAETERLKRNLGIARRTRAGLHLLLRDHDAAQADLAVAIPLINQNDKSARLAAYGHLWDIRGQSALGQDNPAAAIRAFTEALRITETTQYLTFHASLYVRRAEAYRRAGDRRAAERDLTLAIADLQKEEANALDARHTGKWEQLWSGYFSRFQEAYRLLIRLMMDDGRRDRAASAFVYAEAARATEPLDLFLQNDAIPSAFRLIRGERFDLERVREALPAGTFLVQYCVLDDRTYVWVVGRSGWSWLTLPVGETRIHEWTRGLQEAAATRNDEAFERSLDLPFDALLREPLKRIETQDFRRLVIVPDRSMHGLPFAALRDSRAREHLVRRAPVTVAPSATLYALSVLRDAQLPRTGSVLLIENPAFDRRLDVARGLDPLPHAKRQIDAIRRIYGAAARRLSPQEATVEPFFEESARAAMVHFAGHAVANAQMPFSSLLLFAPSAKHSGALAADELLTRLRASRMRLAVLSACRTAGGTTVGPEGLAPLVRSIVAAGVPGVIGTLWDVGANDPVDELLVRFHRHYRDGRDADVALQSAQVEMLRHRDRAFNSPAVWGGFQMIGHASSPYARRPE